MLLTLILKYILFYTEPVLSPTISYIILVTECKRRMAHFLKATQRSRGSWRIDVCIPCRRAGRISHHPRSTRLGSNHPQISALTPKRSAYIVYMLRVSPHSSDMLLTLLSLILIHVSALRDLIIDIALKLKVRNPDH